MIRLLLFCIIFLFFIWLILELFTKNKNEKIKWYFIPKIYLLVFFIIALFLIIRFFPKILSIISYLQGVLAPFIGIFKNLIPFI